ncbi:catechol 2,3-dioxygenase-like lactoylglutathione lyase family enzyme [Hydrogenispora ethanolica]|jgi:lactoylglutathione lyase|uniref:Catechol 2,3-dioxygenase-like lactoylglutathione lyase family enzyme n=1 Tax=Hydrogenispora ethanolica TaxID=1082276 RepID=A0A4R1RU91_HYDET|nr:VOC family protein [Hydrogenispora ethanolica]TCL69969.1 catechol 2,3-dioxygenase-like lactoylglutathione lyase family enzyme [Hydrogenispora ethanolica]
MIGGYRHTGVVVRDLARAVAFYQEVLNYTIWKRAEERGTYIERVVGIPGVILEWVKLKAPDGSVLELLQYVSHPDSGGNPGLQPANRLGCSHIALTVEDITGLYQLLCQKGVPCKSPPQIAPDGKAKVLYCHDPDGNIIELVEDC